MELAVVICKVLNLYFGHKTGVRNFDIEIKAFVTMASVIRFEFESITKNLLIFPFFTSLETSLALKEPSLACCVFNLCECQTRRKKIHFSSLFLMDPNVNIERNIYFMQLTSVFLTRIPL